MKFRSLAQPKYLFVLIEIHLLLLYNILYDTELYLEVKKVKNKKYSELRGGAGYCFRTCSLTFYNKFLIDDKSHDNENYCSEQTW